MTLAVAPTPCATSIADSRQDQQGRDYAIRMGRHMPEDTLKRIRAENLGVYRASRIRLKEDVAQEDEVATNYRGRLVYELLQNADDAMAGAASGADRITFRLTDSDLWVGNSGRPLSDADVEGLCGIGASSKSDSVTVSAGPRSATKAWDSSPCWRSLPSPRRSRKSTRSGLAPTLHAMRSRPYSMILTSPARGKCLPCVSHTVWERDPPIGSSSTVRASGRCFAFPSGTMSQRKFGLLSLSDCSAFRSRRSSS